MLLGGDDYDLVLSLPPDKRLKILRKELRSSDPLITKVIGEGILLRGSYFAHIAGGQFALVYWLRTQDGKEWAVRCLKGLPDSQVSNRCDALIRFLERNPAKYPWFVNLRFYDRALYVAGEHRPIFIMEWIEGNELLVAAKELVEKRNGGGLHMLADAIANMTDELQSADIAHGDLQDRNILVTNGSQLRLVDYDSLALPGCMIGSSPVAGTPGYTHPAYLASGGRPLASTNDTFATVILVLSLRALAVDPTLWAGGEDQKDRLVFSHDDLTSPDNSPIWDRLLASSDTAVRKMARLLQEWCRQPPSDSERLICDVPDLSEMLGLKARWPKQTPRPPMITVSVNDLPELPTRWNSQKRKKPLLKSLSLPSVDTTILSLFATNES